MCRVADAEVVYAAFAARYHGALEPGDAIRWAEDPLATALDGSASPGHLLEERRRALCRAAVDPAVVDAFETAVADWDRELAIARAAMSPQPTAPAAST